MEMFEAGMTFYQLDVVLNIWLAGGTLEGGSTSIFPNLYGLSAHGDPCTISNFGGWRDGHVRASLLAHKLHFDFCIGLDALRFLSQDDDSNQPCGGNFVFSATASSECDLAARCGDRYVRRCVLCSAPRPEEYGSCRAGHCDVVLGNE